MDKMKEVILCYQGEMALKGLNRASFESTLSKILRYRVKDLGKFQVYKAQSLMYVEPRDECAEQMTDEAYDRVRK
ncbi:thiamine biosynthesis/tRNA modification protein ThiI, partial [gut metagenome]